VGEEPRCRRLVASGSVLTGPVRDHTVKVDATGLRPSTTYYYRFLLDGVRSRTGRTRTAPARDADVRRIRFGVVSRANLQAGLFSAYRHLTKRDDIDAVLHLGDYLYEYAPGEYGVGQGEADVREHVPAREVVSLSDYRQRHAQYKADPDLAALHASAAFIVTDDHETTNDAWANGAENHQPDTEGDFERDARLPTAPLTSGCRCACPAPRPCATAHESTAACGSASWLSCPCST
jgi:alkaline phosphatase D